MINNMFAEVMFSNIQQNISTLVERILPETKPKMKSIRTHQWVLDTNLYSQSQDISSSMYGIHDGYNREACELLIQIINLITDVPKGKSDEQNVIWAFSIIGSYIPKPIPVGPEIIKPKIVKPTPKIDKFVLGEFQLVCKTCNYVRDARTDFYEKRKVCKKCYSKQVVKRRMKNDDKIRVSRNAG